MTSVKFLDFQLSRISNPVCDLSYFLYACTSNKILNNLEKYLRIYHESLSLHLRQLGSEPEELFPYQAFLEQWKKYSKYGLMMALVILRLMLCESDESPDLADLVEPGKNAEESWDYSIRNVDQYNSRIRDLVLFMHDNGYL